MQKISCQIFCFQFSLTYIGENNNYVPVSTREIYFRIVHPFQAATQNSPQNVSIENSYQEQFRYSVKVIDVCTINKKNRLKDGSGSTIIKPKPFTTNSEVGNKYFVCEVLMLALRTIMQYYNLLFELYKNQSCRKRKWCNASIKYHMIIAMFYDKFF